MNDLKILLNEEVIYEYARDIISDEAKLTFLDKMDLDMDKGIKIKGKLISQPDINQRAEFVVLNLFRALSQENDAVIGASCAWLTNRLPLLVEVHINKADVGLDIGLVEEE